MFVAVVQHLSSNCNYGGFRTVKCTERMIQVSEKVCVFFFLSGRVKASSIVILYHLVGILNFPMDQKYGF